tara:strand:- start:12110 stop:13027 length:918 start_codon:yes stop_codon:yes gene_type:complete
MPLKDNLIKDQWGNIYYRKQIDKKRIILPAYTKQDKIANKLHSALEYQALKQYYNPKQKTRKVSFKKLVKLFLNNKENINKWSKATKETYIYVLNAYLKSKTFPENKQTAIGYMAKVNACINWGIKKNYKTSEKIRKLPRRIGRTRVFSDKELALIMNSHTNTDLQEFFNFAYYTGARRGEICALKAHQIHPTFIEVKGKSDKRIIKLNSQARHILFCREKLWSYKGDFVSKKFKAYLRSLNIKNGQFHDLRRTFGLNLIKSGVPIFTVSKLLGHSSVNITEQHYAPLLVSDIEEFELPTGSLDK